MCGLSVVPGTLRLAAAPCAMIRSMSSGPDGPSVLEVVSLDPAQLTAWEPAWRALEERAEEAVPFAGFDWLAAWTRVYRPARLAVVQWRVDGVVLALGLVEQGRGGRWRFAGRPVSPVRGLLSAPEDRAAAWNALAAWLREHGRRWGTLDAEGIEMELAAALPRTSHVEVEVPVIALPGSFEDYLAERSAKTRTRFRRILRRVERDGAALSPVDAPDAAAAIDDFVALHSARAAAKGERHPAIDARLARMLESLCATPSAGVRLFELARDGRRLGVTVRIDRPHATWFYNAGFDPAASALTPGIALELASIRDAIGQASRRHDLGPGLYPYKLELGGVVELRADVRAASPTAGGRILRAGEVAVAQARERLPLGGIARSARSRLSRP